MPGVRADVSPVIKPLEVIESRGFGGYDVFRDWVRLMLAALQRDDDTYLDILDGYDRGHDREVGERNADLFSKAFGELMSAMEESNQDVLGEAYESFGMQNEAFGQHFTPWNVSAMMAELQATVEEPDPPVTIADPACGSGRLLVLAARRHDVHTICFGQDKDLLCCQMAALNFCFFNMDGIVVFGDSLKVEKRRAWETRSTIMGGQVREVDPDDVPWPEAAFEAGQEEDEEATVETPDTPDAERVSVEADGGDLDQSELGAWLH